MIIRQQTNSVFLITRAQINLFNIFMSWHKQIHSQNKQKNNNTVLFQQNNKFNKFKHKSMFRKTKGIPKDTVPHRGFFYQKLNIFQQIICLQYIFAHNPTSIFPHLEQGSREQMQQQPWGTNIFCQTFCYKLLAIIKMDSVILTPKLSV